MTRRALMILACLLAGACASSLPEPRPLAKGFHPRAGVVAPYEDGRRHLIAGRYGLAIERFGQALGADRRSLDALNGLAIAYTRVGRFDLAQRHFERALEIDAFSAPTLNNYGRALIEQGRLRDGKPFLDLALVHAARGEGAVIAANLKIMNRVDPPAVVAALRDAVQTPDSNSHRLVRLAANRYRLETPAGRPGRETNAVPSLARAAANAPVASDVGASVVIAGGAGGPGIALATAADLEAVGSGSARPASAMRVAAPHRVIPSPPTAVTGATARASVTGEPS